jgi:prepilin-type processing-associated H-X9-DG protein
MLVYDNANVSFGSVKDGLSNTMMISEQADQLIGKDMSTGAIINDEWSVTSTGGGLFRGHSSGNDQTHTVNPPSAWMDARGQTTTTMRYKINQKDGLDHTGWPCQAVINGVGVGVCGGNTGSGGWNSEGANVPLVSNHPGGVNALFGDGSVHFLSDATDLLVLGQLATRDDGMVMRANIP